MPDYQKELMEYRLKTAKEKLLSAKVLLEASAFKDSIGRSYYAMFSSVRAILALDRIDYAKHAGVIAYFQKEYVKTGIIDKEYSKYISNAFQIRNNCDYADFFLVSKEDALEQFEKASKFIMAIEEYLNARLSENEENGQNEEKPVELPEEETLVEGKVTEESNKEGERVVEKTIAQAESKEPEENTKDTQASSDYNDELQEAEKREK